LLNKQQKFGRESEELAARHLKKNGYKILERNYRTELGEIDIIAKQKKTIVFVEVKARKTKRFGSPKEAITPKKQLKISMVALLYLKKTSQSNARARFDVVTVAGQYRRPEVEIIKNAFELAYR
jgi:putative endonuclease